MSDTNKFMIGGTQWPGLSKLTEECGEVLQVCGKLIATDGDPAHWDGTMLDTRLVEEMGDVLAAIRFLTKHSGLDITLVEYRADEKFAQFEAWHEAQLAKAASR